MRANTHGFLKKYTKVCKHDESVLSEKGVLKRVSTTLKVYCRLGHGGKEFDSDPSTAGSTGVGKYHGLTKTIYS